MSKLNIYRKNIDEIDDKIIELLKIRFSIVEDVKKYKKDNNVAVLDKTRENEIIEKINLLGNQYKNEIKKIYQTLLAVSKDLQKWKDLA